MSELDFQRPSQIEDLWMNFIEGLKKISQTDTIYDAVIKGIVLLPFYIALSIPALGIDLSRRI